MSGKKQTQSSANMYDQARYIKNRTRALNRHLKKFPNDAVAKDALKNVATYRRCKPKAHKKVWTPERRWYAQILVEIGHNGHEALQVHKPKTMVRDAQSEQN